MDHGFGESGHGGRGRVRISHTLLPCPGVALCFSAAIDCTPGEERMPVTVRFTCCSGDFDVSSQLGWVEEMVAATSTVRFSSASNTCYTSVAITVEADDPGNIVVDVDEEGGEDEVVPDGADTGECSICYRLYVVGGATSVKLPCSHVYHRNCLDNWTRVNATCPYCREPVPEGDCFWDEEQDDEDEDDISGDSGSGDTEDDGDEDDTSGDEDYRSQHFWS